MGHRVRPKRDEIALSVQTPNMFVVFRRDARKFDAPVRTVRGPRTQMADPHGIYFDETHNEIVVANHGNFRPNELITSYTAYDARESRPGTHRQQLRRERPRPIPAFVADRLRRRSATATSSRCGSFRGRSASSTGPWASPSTKSTNEIIVANNGDNSILVFPRTATGDVRPAV